MTDRETLEARAKELDVTFPANIGDAKLQAKIEAAEAALNNGDGTGAESGTGETGGAGTDEGNAGTGDGGSDQGQASGDMWHVNCLIAGGRRRAGRRWPGGVTEVSVDDLNADQLKALEADPMITIGLLEAEE